MSRVRRPSARRARRTKKPRGARRGKSVPRLQLVHYQHPDLFGRWLGYEVVGFDRARKTAETRLQVGRKHLSSAGRVHGGAISAFLDFACGAALFPLLEPQAFCSTVELKVNYLRPVENGDCLLARAEVVFQGNRLAVIRALVHRKGDRNPVAMATATYNIVSPPKKAA